jgi:hypothetical protein
MLIRNLHPEEKEIPNVGFVEPGGTIEVPDELAKGLVSQVDAWENATPKKGSK